MENTNFDKDKDDMIIYGERIYDEYGFGFDLFEVVPVKDDECIEDDAFYISGCMLRTFEILFSVDNVFLDECIEVDISIEQWKKCLNRWLRFLNTENFDNAIKELDNENKCKYAGSYDIARRRLLSEQDFVAEKLEEFRKTVSELLKWVEKHEDDFESVCVTDMLK